MKRWLGPIIFGAFCALLAWHTTLAFVPPGLMALAERRLAKLGGVNRMAHAPIVTAASRAIVRPSPDLLYSSCVFDLTTGPLLIDAEPVAAPYWSLSVFDPMTNVAFVENNRQSRGQAIRIAVLRNGQSAPPGYRPVRIDGNQGIALRRILINRDAPIEEIDIARRRSRCWSAAAGAR